VSCGLDLPLLSRPAQQSPAARNIHPPHPFESCGRIALSRRRWLAGHLNATGDFVMGIIWTIIIGFLAGVVAKFISPGSNEPQGFILTTILGIVGAMVATYLGQALGWYSAGQGAGFIGAVVGAIIVLTVWSMLSRRNA
jgi:uncharacterized membrane protein YeaQ/YmgE (transglycosylase-associated protein family)